MLRKKKDPERRRRITERRGILLIDDLEQIAGKKESVPSEAAVGGVGWGGSIGERKEPARRGALEKG